MAKEYLEKGCELSHAGSCDELANMYRKGNSAVLQDKKWQNFIIKKLAS